MGKFDEFAMNDHHMNYEICTSRINPLYERGDDIRTPFARDYTRILHSLAFRRLKHKTQVFFNAAGSDHICTRIEHVFHVESVSSTIAMSLGLNTELTRAIATAHDLGHAPFGHNGEAILSDLSNRYLGESFWHEKNGLYIVDHVELLEDNELNLRNLNLTYAVRDGIVSHCGELDENGLAPRKELFDLSSFSNPGQYNACTWEGCVVKLSDKIAYLGRDIEDAIRLHYLDKEQKEILYDMAKLTNEKAINTTVITHNMIIDLCKNSDPEKGLCFSPVMNEQLNEIKKFNYRNIYNNKRLTPYKEYSKLVINQIFDVLYHLYRGKDTIRYIDSIDYDHRHFVKQFVKWMIQYVDMDLSMFPWAQNITKCCKNEKIYGDLSDEKQYVRAILDYMSGMTDNYINEVFNQLLSC